MKSSFKILFLILIIFLKDSNQLKINKSLLKENNLSSFEEDDSFIEKEQPELSEESKVLISAYQKNPTEENYIKLRESVIKNYNSVLVKKENKLDELKEETLGKPNGESVVAEMNEIVQDMYITYWEHINFSMLRFTDKRFFGWKTSEAAKYEYIPVMGAGEGIYIKRTPVTNSEYKIFLLETKHKAPSNWANNNYPEGEDDLPINYVSIKDVEDYCSWLTKKDGTNIYRLPTESEWELAAGHMPKDADFNAGNIYSGRVSVFKYDNITRGAHGAIDFWGNVWEWTSTIKDGNNVKVKGGSWKSDRTDCRTENRKENRDQTKSYDDVGFRVIQVINGKEPDQKVELATLESPIINCKIIEENKIEIYWDKIEKAINYQIYEYDEKNKIFAMLNLTDGNSFILENIKNIGNKKYLVQAISYVEFSDNVSPEYAIKPIEGEFENFDNKAFKISYLLILLNICLYLLF